MSRPKKYKINESYFDSIVSEKESYILGLIMRVYGLIKERIGLRIRVQRKC